MKNLENYGVQEMNAKEIREIDGGEVPWWYYLLSPGPAYIIGKFEEGCECDVM